MTENGFTCAGAGVEAGGRRADFACGQPDPVIGPRAVQGVARARLDPVR
jgi:hypothetical protein